MPLTTDQLIAQSKAMLAQTAAEGTKAFAGSSYDNASSLIPKEDLQSFKQANPNLNFQYGDLGQYNAAGSTPTITASALQPKTAYNFQTPQTTLIPSVSAPTKTAEDIVNDMYGTPAKNEGQITDLERSVAELTGQLAQEPSRRAQLEGTPEMESKRQQISSLVARANALSAEAQAIPLQMQQQIQEGGANVTKGGIAPIQTAALRNNAIQALSTGALLSAAQGDLTSALDQVDRAVAAEFEPIKAQLAAKRANLEMLMNDPASTREEKRRAAVAEVRLTGLEQEQTRKEEEKKSIYNLASKLAEFGVNSDISTKVQNAKSFEEAFAIASPYMQDPEKKISLENAKLDMSLTKARLARENYELSLLKKYDGLTPTQYKAALEDQKKAIEEAKTTEEANRLQGESINEKIVLLDSLLASSAIDSVVGSNVFARAANAPSGVLGRFAAGAVPGAAAGAAGGAFFGGIGAIPGAIGGALTGGTIAAFQGSKDYFTGSADKLVGQTEQFISKEFIKSLIDAKARGATFGALTKPEQDALTSAASYIGQRRVYSGEGEDKIVTGYDMSEADFKREIGRIRELSQKAYEKSTGKTFTTDEEQVLDAAFSSSSSPIINGNLYFQSQ